MCICHGYSRAKYEIALLDLYIKTFFCFLDSIHLLMYTSMPNASVILYRKILCSTIKHITPRRLTKIENVRALNSNIPTVRIATPDKVKNLQLMIWFNIHDNYIIPDYHFKIKLKYDFQDCKRSRVSIDDENIRLLERISLVDFANKEGMFLNDCWRFTYLIMEKEILITCFYFIDLEWIVNFRNKKIGGCHSFRWTY